MKRTTAVNRLGKVQIFACQGIAGNSNNINSSIGYPLESPSFTSCNNGRLEHSPSNKSTVKPDISE